ncbi:MAG: hypothetical protein KAJ13_11095, partial [Gemmatimonadetes bacterium]|nr:hypothetical protein [Gemmatimonadota bacterium]
MSRSNRGSRRWITFFPVFGACALLAAVSLPAHAGPVDTPVAAATDTVPRHARSSLSLYRDHPSVADVRGVLLKWDQQGGPGSISDSIAIATMWRRARQYRSALEALPSDTSPDGTARPRVTFERARILLQAPPSGPGIPGTFEERRAEGGEAFWTACEGMDEVTRRALWEDLRGLSTPDEQSEWESLDPGPEACGWVRGFVDERAFRMAVSPEERLQIHYARLHEVRGLYYLRKPRLTDDLTDRIGRADSLEVDDRGLIQLRMGVPLVTVEPFMDLNETWAYFRPQGPRVFHFAPVSKTGLRALGDYRLLENLAHASGFTMPSELMGVGGRRLAYLYQSRRVLDYLYEDYHFRQMDSRMRAAGDRFNPGFLGLLAWEREINEADARYAVSGIPDAPELTPGIEFAYETLRFRQPGTDRSEVWFLAATRVGDLTAHAAVDPVTDMDGLVGYDVGAQLAYLASGGMRRLDVVSQPLVEDPLADDDGIPVRFPVTLEPETYPYVLVLRDRGSERGKLGNWVLDTVIISARQFGIPSISDIAVAADSGGTWSRDGVSFLRIGPTHVVSADGTAHVYFEVYGIRPGTAYDVEVRVVPEEEADMAFDVTPEDLAFAVRFPSEASRDRAGLGIGRHYLRI